MIGSTRGRSHSVEVDQYIVLTPEPAIIWKVGWRFVLEIPVGGFDGWKRIYSGFVGTFFYGVFMGILFIF